MAMEMAYVSVCGYFLKITQVISRNHDATHYDSLAIFNWETNGKKGMPQFLSPGLLVSLPSPPQMFMSFGFCVPKAIPFGYPAVTPQTPLLKRNMAGVLKPVCGFKWYSRYIELISEIITIL